MRRIAAFIVAPLAVPLLTVLYLRLPMDNGAFGPASIVSALVAYAGAFIFGVPLYRFLLARRLTAFWIAAFAGFIIGTAMMYVFFALLTRGSISSISAYPEVHWDAVRYGGIAGIVVGIILWLIARPDSEAQRSSSG